MSLPRVLFVTGTDTGVGKTIVTAALAAALSATGRSVAVYKPTQAGLEAGLGDIDVVQRLSGVSSVHEGIRLHHPMAPVAAAALEGVELPPLAQHQAAIERLCDAHDVTLVEGAGGLLVELDGEGHTLADLALAVDRVGLNGGYGGVPGRPRHPEPHRADARSAAAPATAAERDRYRLMAGRPRRDRALKPGPTGIGGAGLRRDPRRRRDAGSGGLPERRSAMAGALRSERGCCSCWLAGQQEQSKRLCAPFRRRA